MLYSPFPAMFSTLSKTNFAILATFELSSANALKLGQSIVLSFWKELIKIYERGGGIYSIIKVFKSNMSWLFDSSWTEFVFMVS